ncbi:M4 family metallopeptidase [Formosa maritima]|uniref:T9SS type A sorting domain-containing protein n=1 Tax=Formosa maritima TaxID=2592046 RepID=A0A5D0G3Y1_9FLAO|nr:M4 family metallopeptidase [Formosa maritima]TYA53853.1 T9SS type A sorting domain-containing protein [Formosa maritima]
MKKTTSLLTCFLLISSIAFSQNIQEAIKKLRTETNAKVTVNNNGVAEFIKFPFANALSIEGSSIQEKVVTFLELNPDLFPFQTVEASFMFGTVKTDNYGFKQLVITQHKNNVPVFDGQLRFHFNADNQLTAINGNYIPNIKNQTIPSISISEAKAIAIETVNKQELNHSGVSLFAFDANLYLFQKGLIDNSFGATFLVYEVEVRNDADVREYMYVNADSGEITEQFTGMAHALDRIVYENSTFNVVWQEGDAFPGTLSIWQQNEVMASEHTYNFFNNAFGYVSYDGADAQMRTINNNPNISCPNANWNGVTANYCNGTASDDVIAHEWGHAYTEYTSGLIYAYQSGAMNEAFSDIWGETIDLLNNYEDADDDHTLRNACNSSDRWRMGEDATAFGGAIRDMWNPPCNGDPGKLTDWNYYCGEGDGGGVHSNSGIPNHTYALLVDGGTFNGQTINGIGFTKAAHIFWRAQSEYLTATSDFYSLADALEASCTDLLGIDLEGLSTAAAVGSSGEVLTASDYNELVNTLIAIELRTENNCGHIPILSATEDPCDSASNAPIFLEDWESGMSGWTVSQIASNPGTWESRDWVLESNLPDGRTGQAIFGVDPVNGNCTTSLQNGILRLESPVIIIPNQLTGTFEMTFMHYVSTEDSWDGTNIKYSLDGGSWTLLPLSAFTVNAYNGTINNNGNDNPMAGEPAFTGSDGGSTSGSWGRSYIDLSVLGVAANSTIQFRFEVGTDGCNGREGWYVDDISVYNCEMLLSVTDFESLQNSIKVFPNPSNGEYTIKNLNNIDLVKAEIYDINGRLINTIDLSSGQNLQTIDITQVTSGIYFMNVYTKDATQVIKLIKQ